MKFLQKFILIVFCSLAMLTENYSQIDFGLFYNSNSGEFEVYVYPTQSFASTTVSTAQVTIVFPSSYAWDQGPLGNEWQNNISLTDVTGGWTANTLVEAPCTNSGSDYLSVALDFNSFPLMSLTSGSSIILFTFVLDGDCPGELGLIENNVDPFHVPNNLCGGTTSPGNSFILTASNPTSFSFTEDYDSNLTLGNTDCNELSTSGPLPLELLSFTGHLVDDFEVLLEWETTNEEDVKYFVVEHADDGRNYTAIGNRESRGNGLEGIFDYDLTHYRPIRGINYYRLKSVDLDGSFEYSKVVEITIKNELDGIVLFPNPTTGKVTLQMPDFIGFSNTADLHLQVYDVLHHLISEKTVNAVSNQMVDVDLAGLIPGSYILRVTHGSNAFNELIILEEMK